MSSYSTVAEVRALVQGQLRDTNAKEWSTATIDAYVNYEHRWLFGELVKRVGSGFGIAEDTIAVAAGTRDFSLAGLTDAATLPFKRIMKLWHIKSSGAEIPVDEAKDAEFNEFRDINQVSSEETPIARVVRRGGTELLQILPLATGQRTFRIEYYYKSPTLADSADLHTPAEYDDLIVARVQRRCLVDKNQVNAALEGLIGRREVEVFEDAASTNWAEPRRRGGDGNW